MFAIVNIAGSQERVEEGMTLRVPTLDAEQGATVTFDQVFLLATGPGDIAVGTPTVLGVSVAAKVLAHGRSPKILVRKMRRRKRTRKTIGHRQGYTEIEVTKIVA